MQATQKEKNLYFINEQIDKLNSKFKEVKTKLLLKIIPIGIITIMVVSLSIYLIYYLMNSYNSKNNTSWFDAIGPQILAISLAIITFFIIFFISIFKAAIKIDRYKQAFERIRFVSAQYLRESNKYELNDKSQIYKEKIIIIVNRITNNP